MGFVTPEQIAQAKEIDLLTYLRSCDPYALVHVGGNTYCTREHDSLKISNGKWNWFSRGDRINLSVFSVLQWNSRIHI